MEAKRSNFFTRLFARKTDDQIEPVYVPDQDSIPTVASTVSQCILVFTPEQEEKYSEHEKAALQEQVSKLPPLPIGEINFVPFECGRVYEGYYIRLFIRNGFDVMSDFTINELHLHLIDATGEKVAFGVFKPKDFGAIRFGEARVWTFAWRPEQVLNKNADLTQFSVAFD